MVSGEGKDEGYVGSDNLEIMQEAVNYNRWLTEKVVVAAGKHRKVVDFGAGSGTFARLLAERDFDVTAVEPDEELRRKIRLAGTNCVADLAELPPASCDFIYSLNVLEHIEADHTQLRALGAALRPGGGLYLYVPAFESLFSSMDAKVGHFRRYRREPLVRMMKNAGFEVRSARYVDAVGFAASLAYRFLGSDDGSINLTAVKVFDRFCFPLNRIADPLFGRMFGKNLSVVAVRR